MNKDLFLGAYRDGVDPELKPLELVIRTQEDPDGIRVVVKDNGPGYYLDSDKKDTPHIGLQNVKDRLWLMCHGRLEIINRPNGGTAVTLFIPEKPGAIASVK